ncbi:hypothetical protein GCM10012275_08110 [Longimycelium tulufanense]|uniref:Minor tail protein n=1 Tax=Longimycelium tulufanense TaxID=907463 RepID=A0A8J3C9I8_9PSEU|nr:hypothetical protein [Longimycelium tulufanense]GGM39623.1 hypothetical protein GCM10012275_08110 [Longimycelium tulufanense]
MDTQYRVVWGDLRDEVAIAELECSSLKYSHVLKAPGNASLTARLEQPSWDEDVNLHTRLIPRRTFVAVEKNGYIDWVGILTTWSADLENATIQLDCQGIWEYARHLPFPGGQYDQRGQGDIVKSLIDVTQNTYGAPVVDTSRIPTNRGPWRDRSTYHGYEYKSFGELVEQLSNVINGFDFRIQSEWIYDPATGVYKLRNYFEYLYPLIGRLTDFVWRHGDNCEVTTVKADGTGIATRAITTGAGEAEEMLTSHRFVDRWTYNPATHTRTQGSDGTPDLEDRIGGFLPYVRVESYSDVSIQSTLDDKAQTLAEQGQSPVILPELIIHPQQGDLTYGDFQVGDIVQVEVSHGILQLRGRYKVVQVDVEFQDTWGAERLSITVAPLSSFPSPPSAVTSLAVSGYRRRSDGTFDVDLRWHPSYDALDDSTVRYEVWGTQHKGAFPLNAKRLDAAQGNPGIRDTTYTVTGLPGGTWAFFVYAVHGESGGTMHTCYEANLAEATLV